MATSSLDFQWIKRAIEAINSGLTKKVISPDKKVQIYQCGSVIRIDIKEE